MTRGHQAKFSCTVNFQLPQEEITYSWKFAGGGVSRSGASAKGLGGGLCFSRGWVVRTQRVGLGGARSRFRLRARGGSLDLEVGARLRRWLRGAGSCVKGQCIRG